MNWDSRRENWNPRVEDARDVGDVDYARVIHSASFRRLQGKTQILNLGDSDFYRTRLTHSLEVAQIAGGITKQLSKTFPDHEAFPYLPDRSLIQAIGCTHDLGHPPFGHGGEVALNYCMRGHGGFEGNGQTLRILTRLENFSMRAGANLARRTLLGVLKYPVSYTAAANPLIKPELDQRPTAIRVINTKNSKPPKCYLDSEKDVVSWVLEDLKEYDQIEFQKLIYKENKHSSSVYKSFDCSIMDIADDIAYGVHDLEDAIALHLIREEKFREKVTEISARSFLDAIKNKYPTESRNNVYENFVGELFGDSGSRKHCISRLIHHFVTATEIVKLGIFSEPLLDFKADLKNDQKIFLESLKDIVRSEVIKSPNVQHLEFKGQFMVVSVFEAIETDPERLLPKDALRRYEEADHKHRIICDYVSGMTDNYLLKTYDRLFSPRMGSVFDKL